MNFPATVLAGVVGGALCGGLFYLNNKGRAGMTHRVNVIGAAVTAVGILGIVLAIGGARYT
jgi:hypothetical protein